MDSKFEPDRILRSLHRNLVQSIDDARDGTTSGEVGDDIERSIRDSFSSLGDLLPPGLAVGTGFVIDSFGNIGRQTDIIVYEKELCRPIFRRTPNSVFRYYPCEGVVAAGEVKSKLNRDTFNDAIVKIDSLKTLKRFFQPSEDEANNVSVRSYTQHDIPAITHSYPRESGMLDILCFVVAGDSEVGCDTVLTYLKSMDRNQRKMSCPDAIIAMRSKSHDEGYAILPVTEFHDGLQISSARQADGAACAPSDDPLGILINGIYLAVEHRRTTPQSSFQRYLDAKITTHLQGMWVKNL